MIYVVATTQVKPELRDAFIKGAKECVAATRKEKGCISYDGHTSILDPNLFVMVEGYLDRYEELGTAQQLPARLLAEEYRFRHRFGDRRQR